MYLMFCVRVYVCVCVLSEGVVVNIFANRTCLHERIAFLVSTVVICLVVLLLSVLSFYLFS